MLCSRGTVPCTHMYTHRQTHTHVHTQTDKHTHTCIQVLNLKPGTVGCIEEAMYGDRTSFLDVTSVLAAAVDGTNTRTHERTHTHTHVVERNDIEKFTINNASMGIIDRNEANPGKNPQHKHFPTC